MNDLNNDPDGDSLSNAEFKGCIKGSVIALFVAVAVILMGSKLIVSCAGSMPVQGGISVGG